MRYVLISFFVSLFLRTLSFEIPWHENWGNRSTACVGLKTRELTALTLLPVGPQEKDFSDRLSSEDWVCLPIGFDQFWETKHPCNELKMATDSARCQYSVIEWKPFFTYWFINQSYKRFSGMQKEIDFPHPIEMDNVVF